MSKEDMINSPLLYKCIYWCFNDRLNENNEQVIYLSLYIPDINSQYKYFIIYIRLFR